MPRSVVALLLRLGHQVEFARDIGLAAAQDGHIAARARMIGATLLTRDLDFADIRQYPPEGYAGIVVMRLPDDATAQVIVSLIERFVREPGFLAALAGRLAIVEPERVRFRPPLT